MNAAFEGKITKPQLKGRAMPIISHHVPNGVEVGGVVVGRRGRVGGEVRVEGEAVGDLVEGHLKQERGGWCTLSDNE